VDRPLPVFIPHWNRPFECVRSVRELAHQRLSLAITVLDNASSTENFNILRRDLPRNVELIRLAENAGWGPALNILLSRWLMSEEGDYCVVSAHDALLQPHCLRRILEAMRNDERIGIACPEYGVSEIPTYSPLRYVRFEAVQPRREGSAERISVLHGTLMVLRRHCLEEIGLFDERYFAYGDEHELGLRANSRGWATTIVWGAVVENPGTWTPCRLRSYLFARNSLLLAQTYGSRSVAVLRSILIVGNTVRLMLRNSTCFALSPVARFAAIIDYWRGKHGRPAAQLKGARG
jgi:N-acetylglucosaminyl-diphospho-decaprenol L-rhamnosyltransferase